jgi:uncharacterized protein (DUF488 family)
VRAQLASTGDYAAFFAWYDSNVIPHLADDLRSYIVEGEGKKVALMCVEEDQLQCHRSRIAAALRQMGFVCTEIP